MTSGCTVRFGDAGPVVYTNAMHYVVGCEAVSVDSQGAWSSPRPTTFDPSSRCTPHQTKRWLLVASRSVFSVARTTIGSCICRGRVLNLNSAADYARISGEYANLWVGWVNADPSPAS